MPYLTTQEEKEAGGFKKAGVHPINRNKILLLADNSASKQSTKAGKYISDVYSVYS